jgi:hypothetical protein
MPRFSASFGINKQQSQLDFVDIDTDEDKQLFIDPRVFSESSDAWSLECNDSIISFFQAVLDAIGRGDDARGRTLLDSLHEPNETFLGVSAAKPAGRGIGRAQADQLYDRIKRSRAAQTGLLSELSDFELFIPGIGDDKVSDITTNIIRHHLIRYTQVQCDLHGIDLIGDVPSGMIWDAERSRWTNRYVQLPVINGQKVLLLPKASVRWRMSFSHPEYYNKYVLEFLQAEHLRRHTGLVETLKDGRRRVTKKSLKEVHPLAKDFLAAFTEQYPEVLERYKRVMGVSSGVTNEALDEGFDERAFAAILIEELNRIQPGNTDASRFHNFMIGTLEFIFYPELIYPEKEQEINEGRKRIDILYTNNSSSGFFFRRRTEARTGATRVVVECKNYVKELANPELDQIAGRFSPVRGRLGMLVARGLDDRENFIKRCRDTAHDDHGFIMLFIDRDIQSLLSLISDGKRTLIDRFLEQRFGELIT